MQQCAAMVQSVRFPTRTITRYLPFYWEADGRYSQSHRRTDESPSSNARLHCRDVRLRRTSHDLQSKSSTLRRLFRRVEAERACSSRLRALSLQHVFFGYASVLNTRSARHLPWPAASCRCARRKMSPRDAVESRPGVTGIGCSAPLMPRCGTLTGIRVRTSYLHRPHQKQPARRVNDSVPTAIMRCRIGRGKTDKTVGIKRMKQPVAEIKPMCTAGRSPENTSGVGCVCFQFTVRRCLPNCECRTFVTRRAAFSKRSSLPVLLERFRSCRIYPAYHRC